MSGSVAPPRDAVKTCEGGDPCHLRFQGPPPDERRLRLLQLDARAGRLELLLGLVGLVPGDALENGLGRGVDQVLGLLQPEAGERPDLLDDLDLLVARRVQHDVELGLLLFLLDGGRAGAGGGRAGGQRDGSRRGHAEGLLELLHELRQLQEGHLLEGVQEVVARNLGHWWLSLLLSPVGRLILYWSLLRAPRLLPARLLGPHRRGRVPRRPPPGWWCPRPPGAGRAGRWSSSPPGAGAPPA